MFQNMFILSVTKYAKFAWFVFTLCTFVKPVIDLQLNPQLGSTSNLEAPEKLSSPLHAALCAIWLEHPTKYKSGFFTSTLLLIEFLLPIVTEELSTEKETHLSHGI